MKKIICIMLLLCSFMLTACNVQDKPDATEGPSVTDEIKNPTETETAEFSKNY